MIDKYSLTPEEENEFFMLVGRAVTEWAEVEDHLFHITHSILHTSRELAAIVFYRTPNIDARLTLTNDLMTTLCPPIESGDHKPQWLITWEKLQRDIKGELPTRNQLAHHPYSPFVDVLQSEDGEDYEIATIRPGIVMSPAEMLRKHRASLPLLDKKDVQTHLATVKKFVNRLQMFRANEFLEQLKLRDWPNARHILSLNPR